MDRKGEIKGGIYREIFFQKFELRKGLIHHIEKRKLKFS